MKPLFFKKYKIILILIMMGIILVFAGLVQSVTNMYTVRKVVQDQVQSSVNEKNEDDNKNNNRNTNTDPNTKSLKNGREFFTEYRLERDRSRSQQIDLLREIVNNPNSPEESKKEAHRRLLEISQAIDTEMKLENLIRAEDFKDAVVFVQDNSATVIVQAPLLTDIDKEKLIEMTVRVTGLKSENIVVIPKA